MILLLRRLGIWLLLCCCYCAASAQLAVPDLTGHVVDSTGTLTALERTQLEAKLSAFELSHGSQLVLLMVPSSAPEDIASYANRVANYWKIGRKEVGDGLLLVVAVQDRKLRFEVAKTLEGAIPDLAAKRIITQTISPLFKQAQYAAGIEAGLEQAMSLIRGEALPVPSQARAASQGFDWMELAVFMFMAVPVVGTVSRNILGSKLGALATGGVAGAIAMLVTSSLLLAALASLIGAVFTLVSAVSGGRGRSGWHGGAGAQGWSSGNSAGGGFGGGFGSGGGGDFGGGGASGDW